MASATKVMTTHVPLPLADKVDAMAARLDRSRGWIVKQALSAWVELEEQRHLMTLEGLADADEGRLFEQTEMERWAESFSGPTPLPPPTL